MRQPNYDAENARLADEAHAAHFGHGLKEVLDPDERVGYFEPCPRCGDTRFPLVVDLHGPACEGCAEHDAEGDIVTSEEGVM